MEIRVEGYDIQASAYFGRASRNLEVAETERKADYFFYAALEFRNCIERVLFEYLYLTTGDEDWLPKWEKEYRPTRLKDKILGIEPEFFEKLRFANLQMRVLGLPQIHIIDLDALSQLYGRLGNHLHASKRPDKTSDSPRWWGGFYHLLKEARETLLQVFIHPRGFVSLNERGWQLYSKWRAGSVTDEQAIEEFRRAIFGQ